MKLFIDRLIDKVEAKNSHVCVGLDPHLDILPSFLVEKYMNESKDSNLALARAVLEFNKKLIDKIADIAVAVKPQIAFYELLGTAGLNTLKETIKYANEKGLIIILDAKRNDIGSTAGAYAEAYLGLVSRENSNKKYIANKVDVDCMTINPYLGYDGIKPFLVKKDKGAFVLVRTSNESAVDIQDLETKDGKKVFEKVGELVSQWGQPFIGEYGYSNLGAVIGATYPEELKILRKAMPHTYFLLPGFGFQGGKPQDIAAGFNDDGKGALVNSSRGINFAYQRSPWNEEYTEEQFAEAARAAVIKMKEDINQYI